MFLKPPGEPTKFKKAVYLSMATILGALLSLLAHAIIEMYYLSRAYHSGQAVKFYGGCALRPDFQAVLWVIGIAGGFLLGRRWWRIIYIERKYWQGKK